MTEKIGGLYRDKDLIAVVSKMRGGEAVAQIEFTKPIQVLTLTPRALRALFYYLQQCDDPTVVLEVEK